MRSILIPRPMRDPAGTVHIVTLWEHLPELGILLAAEMVLATLVAIGVLAFMLALFAVILVSLVVKGGARLVLPARASRGTSTATHPSPPHHTPPRRR